MARRAIVIAGLATAFGFWHLVQMEDQLIWAAILPGSYLAGMFLLMK